MWRTYMKLHQFEKEFLNLCNITAAKMGLPLSAIKRDYFIVLTLQKLQDSNFAQFCVFKGGTSLSKCYPGSIDRFSEDIDLTYIPQMGETDITIEKNIKMLERIMTTDFRMEKIQHERTPKNKSCFIHFDEDETKIKLEIGSSIRPEPYSKKYLTSYIQQYLESINAQDAITTFQLLEIGLNVLDISRTFVDKLMAVKRHALCGTLHNKVRHIYDVTKLYLREDIQALLHDDALLKNIVQKVKQTDEVYLEKRNSFKDYQPLSPYNFEQWKDKFDAMTKQRYERLHEDLLYTKERQDFSVAMATFSQINTLLIGIKE